MDRAPRFMGTDHMRLKDKVAIITGGASGIGRATAELFVSEGARVAIVDWHDAAFGELTKPGSGHDAMQAHTADVTDAAAAERIVGEVRAAWGRVDILVTSAAVSVGKKVAETSFDDWRHVLEVNVTGTFAWARAVLPGMVEQGSGAIVTVGSQLSTAGGRSNAAYVTSKGAIVSLTRSIAIDYAEAGVRCNCVAPGGTDTPLLQSAFVRSPKPQQAKQELVDRHAMRRLGAPGEIALGILYLASSESSFVTGTQLVIDGGWLAA
jgi:NAD(P)-dependent dehydrogenase (short-subunit alcohol dehydrogenase family)